MYYFVLSADNDNHDQNQQYARVSRSGTASALASRPLPLRQAVSCIVQFASLSLVARLPRLEDKSTCIHTNKSGATFNLTHCSHVMDVRPPTAIALSRRARIARPVRPHTAGAVRWLLHQRQRAARVSAAKAAEHQRRVRARHDRRLRGLVAAAQWHAPRSKHHRRYTE